MPRIAMRLSTGYAASPYSKLLAVPLMLLLACSASDIGDVPDNSPFDGLECEGDCGAGASAYGSIIGTYRGVPAYSNGATHGCHDCSVSSELSQAMSLGLACGSRCQDTVSSSPQTPYGLAYQCVEYFRRFYASVYADKQVGDSRGNAKDYFVKNNVTKVKTLPEMGFNCWQNGADSVPPELDDVIIWTNGIAGHVGIVKYVDNKSIGVIQQNNSNASSDANCVIPLDMSNGKATLASTACGIKNSALVWCRRPSKDWSKCSASILCPDGYSCFGTTCKSTTCGMASCNPIPVDYYPYFSVSVAGSTSMASTSYVAISDMNRDTYPDIITSNANDSVSVASGNGNGTFMPAKIYSLNSGVKPIHLATGDFNNDSNTDIVTVNELGRSLAVLPGNADGSLGSAQYYSVGIAPWYVAVGDLNRDGKQDLIVANRTDGNVGVLLNNGLGAFLTQVTYQTGRAPVAIAVGDLNLDSKNDIIVTNLYDGNISVLLGNGDGSLQGQRTFSVGINPNHIAVADVTGDGKLDAIVANSASGISFLKGNGDGTFQTQTALVANGDWVSLRDLNLDSLIDIEFVSANGNAGYMLNAGGGIFGTAKAYSIGPVSFGIAVEKLNQDMVPDIVAATTYTTMVGVLLSR